MLNIEFSVIGGLLGEWRSGWKGIEICRSLMDVVNCVSPTFAMSGALAWQVKKPNKKENIFGFWRGRWHGIIYLFILPGSPPSVLDRLLVSLSFYPLSCFCWTDTKNIAHRTRKPVYQQESALTTSIHHPKVYSAIDKLISKYIIIHCLH